MAHSDARRRHGDSPKSPTTPTMEQLLQGDASWWAASSGSSSITSPRSARTHEVEEDHSPHHKKSVLSKVKERAKKLRHSLSKKKHGQDDGSNTTPSWGVSMEDGDEDEIDYVNAEDPEYFGAPMYESELAPATYKETARQHPRSDPVVPENHMLPTNIKTRTDEQKETPPTSPNKTLTETFTEKLAPAYATVSEATHVLASKIQGLTVSTEQSTEKQAHDLFKNSTAEPKTHMIGSKIQGLTVSTEPESAEHDLNRGEQIWDKGVSVKEYLMNKFEPGDDERALSHAISEAMSPRKSARAEKGMVDKVKEAVNSLLRSDESGAPVHNTITTSTTKSVSRIPVSTNVHQEIEEENHGRILQAN